MNTPAMMSDSVLASAPAVPKSASFLPCSSGSGYIWTTISISPTLLHPLIMLIEDGMVSTASTPLSARSTKKAYWLCTNEMARYRMPLVRKPKVYSLAGEYRSATRPANRSVEANASE